MIRPKSVIKLTEDIRAKAIMKNDNVKKAVATQIVNSFRGVRDSGTSTSFEEFINSNMCVPAFMLRFAKVDNKSV
jgi:hypothetical protein